MNQNCHCSREAKARTVKNGAGWLIPGVMLVLMPKCPLCLAAWMSVLFGIGLSATTAKVMHVSLVSFCLLTASLFFTRQLVLFLKHRHSTH